MAHLRSDDVREMLQILEDGINLIPKLDTWIKYEQEAKSESRIVGFQP